MTASVAMASLPSTIHAQEPGHRPTIGLVLSGGGARGLAHVGVLEVLEELRVPVDVVTGTSMGAIVGGLYASGLPPDSLRAVVDSLEWDRILADTPPRAALAFQRRETERRYPVELEIGIARDGLLLPGGLIAGQDLELLLRRHTLPVAPIEDFTRLPIPFAAVATDIETGERVVLDGGDIVEAMRASMAIPVVFSPVEIDGRILVDGGLVDNLPVELARAMGADVLIAVDASPPLLERDELRTLLGVSQQIVHLLARQNQEARMASADAAIDLRLEGVGIFDFRDADSIIAMGAAAARDNAATLARWSLPADAYEAWRAARQARRPALAPMPAGLAVQAPAWVDERLVRARVDYALLDTLDVDLAERAARNVFAIGEFDRVGYDLSGEPSRPTFVVTAVSKPRGPDLLRLGIDLVMDSADEDPARIWFAGRAAYVRTRIGDRAAEWRTDLLLGTLTGIETAYHQPLDFAGEWFLEPSITALEEQRPVFAAERTLIEYETRRFLAAVDLGRSLGSSAQVRAGFAWGRTTSRLDPGREELTERFPETGDGVGELRASLSVDRLDSINLPREGVLARAAGRWSHEKLGAERSWARVELDGRVYGSRGRHTAFAAVSGGAASETGDLPVREEFLLGGFGSLSGFGDGELRGEAFAAVRLGWLSRIAEMPPTLRALVAGGWIEAGDAWSRSDGEDFELHPAVTAAIGAETILGPVFLALARAEGGRGRVTVALGRYP